MKILYTPHRATLAQAMEELKEFSSLKDMFDYVETSTTVKGQKLCDSANLCIKYYGYDERINWETYIVCDCSERVCKEYGTPQIIGSCTFQENSTNSEEIKKIEFVQPAPLTIDEIRKLPKNEIVWIERINTFNIKSGEYYIVRDCTSENLGVSPLKQSLYLSESFYRFSEYKTTWVAYLFTNKPHN